MLNFALSESSSSSGTRGPNLSHNVINPFDLSIINPFVPFFADAPEVVDDDSIEDEYDGFENSNVNKTFKDQVWCSELPQTTNI